MLNTMVSLVLLVIARTARIACGLTDRQTDTHTQDKYCNPRCACAPRVNYYRQICMGRQFAPYTHEPGNCMCATSQNHILHIVLSQV